MPSVIRSGDELTELPEASSASENGGIQVQYDISQQRTIPEEEGDLGACPQKVLQS